MGVSRQHFYDIKTASHEQGLEGLTEKSPLEAVYQESSRPAGGRGGGDPFHSIDINGSFGHFGQKLRRIEPPERFLDDHQGLPNHCCCFFYFLVSLRCGGPDSHGGKGRLHRGGGPKVLPVFLRKRIKGHHSLPISCRLAAQGMAVRSALASACSFCHKAEARTSSPLILALIPPLFTSNSIYRLL